MLVKEPTNEFDPKAIMVQTLHGAKLGYVPRELTGRFPADVTFAAVESVGAQKETGLFGVQVRLAERGPVQ